MLFKQDISTIICDFDNTLFNWFDQWYNSFSKLLERLELLGFPKDDLINSIKFINKSHGTSEYHNLLNELQLLNEIEKKDEIVLDLKQFYLEQKNSNLKLYPGVLETLKSLRTLGCSIIIYTESRALYSNERLVQLGLDGVVHKIYSPAHHIDLEPCELEGSYKLQCTQHILLPKQDIKPNPKTLTDIISQVGAKKEQVIYIGDSKMKDIQMANKAGVTSVWAKYGCDIAPKEYELLKLVSHWTDEDIAKEEEIRRNANDEALAPVITLDISLSQIFEHFNFKEFKSEAN